jgi:multisubunit Na+/H+ antiporter MnhG subunit
MSRLALGIILLVFGIVGLFLIDDWYKEKRQSYTGHQLIWGTYLLLIVGSLLILVSLLKWML